MALAGAMAQQCSTTGRMPTVYVPHGGGPLPLLGAASQMSVANYLKNLSKSVPKPKAILTVTAHWESDKVMVSTCPQPSMLYDYYGFPPESYKLRYPAPGSPEVAQRTLELLAAAGIRAAPDHDRGFDHGTFVPLMLAYPAADVPVVQMSLLRSLDPRSHLAVGAALAPLRDEGVLILGSGLSGHNMGVFHANGFGMGGPVRKHGPSEEFDSWLQQACTSAKRADMLSAWAKAPGARECHPREEHLLPLMVVAGAAGDEPGRTVYNDYFLGMLVSGFMFGA